jgi:hypothetical protein
MLTTTLNILYQAGPCDDEWKLGLELLGKSEPDDDPVLITDILDAMGLGTALWCLQATDRRSARLLASECVCRILHIYEAEHPWDYRPRVAVETSALYADGLATSLETKKARQGVGAAFNDVEGGRAVFFAACAAYDAVSGASYDAARRAALVADAAYESACGAAGGAARAADRSSRSALSPSRAARRSERKWQADRLREICAMGGYPPSEPTEEADMLTPATCAIVAQFLEQEKNRFARWLHNHGEPGEADKIISAMREVGRDGYRNNNLFGMPYWIYGDTLYWIGGHSLYCAGVDTIFINYEAEDNTS